MLKRRWIKNIRENRNRNLNYKAPSQSSLKRIFLIRWMLIGKKAIIVIAMTSHTDQENDTPGFRIKIKAKIKKEGQEHTYKCCRIEFKN